MGKVALLLGILLIVLGVVALVWQGISWTTQEEVADLGPIEVTEREERTIPLPPILGAISLIGGIALVAVGAGSSD